VSSIHAIRSKGRRRVPHQVIRIIAKVIVSVTNIMMMMLLRKMLSKMSMMMRRMETR
jgi:hypothetical protein